MTIVCYSVMSGSMSAGHGESSGCGWWRRLTIWRVAANTLKEKLRTYAKGWSSSMRVWESRWQLLVVRTWYQKESRLDSPATLQILWKDVCSGKWTWDFKQNGAVDWVDLVQSGVRVGSNGELFEDGNESWGSTQCGEVFDCWGNLYASQEGLFSMDLDS
jgi:hypothetical protein